MNQTTRSILIAALKQDGNFSPEQITGVMANLDHKTRSGNDPPSLLLTQSQVGRLLSCSRWTIRRLAADGFLKPIKMRGLIRYRRNDLEQLIANGADITK